MDASVQFRWLGVAGIELQGPGGQVLAIDPFFTRPPMRRLWFGRVQPDRALSAQKLPRCDWLLVTHAHFDHVMDVPDVLRHTGATAYGSANTCGLLTACGVPGAQVRRIAAAEALDLGAFHVQVLPALHTPTPGFGPGALRAGLRPPLRLRDYRLDCDLAFLVEVGGLRLLDWGGVSSQCAVRADVLCAFPFGAREGLQALLEAVRPRLVIPLHWDDLFRSLSRPLRPFLQPPRWAWPPLQRVDLAEFARSVERLRPGTKVLVPEAFRAYDLCELAGPVQRNSRSD